jgi:hypothetical protein
LLIKRHSYCRRNVTIDLCEPKRETSSPIEKLLSEAINEFKLYEEEKILSPGWVHNCQLTGYNGPMNELENFHLLSQDAYVEMHLPKLGDKKCGSYEFVVENTIQYNEVTYVDFILKTSSKVATVQGKEEKIVQDCDLIEN